MNGKLTVEARVYDMVRVDLFLHTWDSSSFLSCSSFSRVWDIFSDSSLTLENMDY